MSTLSSASALRRWLTPVLSFLGGAWGMLLLLHRWLDGYRAQVAAGADPVTLDNYGLGDDLYGLYLALAGATVVVVIADYLRGAWTRH